MRRPGTSRHTFPAAALRGLAELGCYGVAVPAELGGAGLDYLALAVILEEIAAGDGATSTVVSVNNCPVCSILMAYGNADQQQRFLVPLARGEQLGAFCLTEPHVGSEAGGLKTTAVRDGDDYVLNGVKQFITSGKHGDLAIVMAVTDKAAGKKGISAFVVPTAHARLRGGAAGRQDGPARQRHGADQFRELPRAGREPAGRRGHGAEDRAQRPGGRAHRHRQPGRGHGARRLRGRAGLQQGARELRPAHLQAPGGAVQAGRHGDADRGRAPADLACREPEGRRPALPEGSRDGQALRQRDGRARVQRRDPGASAATAT